MNGVITILRRSPRASLGLGILVTLVLLALLAPAFTAHSPTSQAYGTWLKPGGAHLLGTTALGQDIWAQLLYGARLTLLIGFAVGLVATAIATAMGLAAAYFGGKTDEAINVLLNVFLVLPGLPLLIIASAFLRGGGVWSIILVISLTGWAWGARVLRSQALALRNRDFVQAAVASGEGAGRIIFAEMLPNLAGLIAANFFGTALYAVLSEAGLAFLGMGDVSQVTWGTMLYWAQAKGSLLQGAWWWVAAPGLCIALLGTAFALINFGIDEVTNPRVMHANKATRVLRRKHANAAPLASPGSAQSLLAIRNLDAGYVTPGGNVRAVRDVSLDVAPGEFLGLAGESGCGKSTLAFAATRLLDAPGVVFGGEARLAGKDLLGLSPEELRRVRWKDYSLVFQASMNILNPVLKVREQVYDAMQAHGIQDQAKLEARARELFQLVGIREDYLSAYPHQLSGGMKQRVVIAIALALEPKLVVMDEPTTALDVVVQRQILQEIDAVRRRLGISIVFITHDLSLLVEMSDRIAIMYAGEVVEEASASAIYTHPKHPYTRKLMSAFPPLEGPRERRAGIPGRPPALSQSIQGCPFFERCPSRMPGVCNEKPLQKFDEATGHSVACFLYDPTVDPQRKEQHEALASD
ncbi:dipeptide/oligopeptide/nickel ABC transporter permease/ATP-binding protein [Deinococcus peraridilitoris]|uniref:Oligopeptide/dipeptide ABC transporter, ATP-binding protein n=1 Tax=Deinococcus peraridilitoris (strain DSM 19664 / LMG 22246 / CIP 109416 / KR-200) TaxID=937777 RepID=K9ZWZ0_DEIPD|nr:dipeptide/oligopeptide/nickel ABC transporter permease/ATP-binding protein [Deinococcus peraridilitoris]AFZ65699.1 oligopeptide/dipeptide ABC transporter, ATP-binding protein [Deinococcus peraridilitoris DSM 19664]